MKKFIFILIIIIFSSITMAGTTQLSILNLDAKGSALVYVFTQSNVTTSVFDYVAHPSRMSVDARPNDKLQSLGTSQIAIRCDNGKKIYIASLWQGAPNLRILKMKPEKYQIIAENEVDNHLKWYSKNDFSAALSLDLKPNKKYFYKLVFTAKGEKYFFTQITEDQAKNLLTNASPSYRISNDIIEDIKLDGIHFNNCTN